MKRVNRWVRSIFALCVIVLSQGVFAADAVVDVEGVDFSGKTITIIVPFKEGGGGDVWARLIAPILPQYLPGNPEIIVSNRPGVGSIKAANAFAEEAIPDGLTVFVTALSTQFPFLLGDPRVRYDYNKWRVLVASRTGGVVYTTPVFGLKNASEVAKLRDKRLVFSSQGVTSNDLVSMLSFELLGLDVKPIFGVRGRGAARLAFERGDTTIDFQTSAGFLKYVKPLVAQGRATPLFSLGALDERKQMVRDPEFPELPHFAEVYENVHGKPPSGLAWDSWFAFFSAGFAAQKFLVLPKETPQSIVTTYQNAFKQLLQDPDYLEGKKTDIGGYEHVAGERAENLYKLATQVPGEQKQWVKDWLRERHKVKL